MFIIIQIKVVLEISRELTVLLHLYAKSWLQYFFSKIKSASANKYILNVSEEIKIPQLVAGKIIILENKLKKISNNSFNFTDNLWAQT